MAPPLQDWRLTLAWDGTAFSGWQRQPDQPTLQQTVEEALSSVLGGEPVRVVASGRTDTGVHALAQVVSFSTTAARTPKAIRSGLNANLPPQIACLEAEPAPPGFDARRWTRRKLYRYRVLARAARCPHRHQQTWHVRRPLDLAAMQQAIAVLQGSHDFSSFRASGCTALHPRRHIESARVVAAPDDELHLEFVGNGFLRHQVRIMAGTLIDIGEGRRAADTMPAILAAADRTAAGRTAPAHGLWLVWVEVGDTPRLGPKGAEADEEDDDE